MLSCDFTECYMSTNVEEIWAIIENHISAGMSLYIPKVKLHAHQYPKWFTPTLCHNINRLNTLRRKVRKKPKSLHNAQHLKDSEATVQQEILDAKANYGSLLILNFATNRDPKLFHHLKSMSKCDLLPPLYFF